MKVAEFVKGPKIPFPAFRAWSGILYLQAVMGAESSLPWTTIRGSAFRK